MEPNFQASFNLAKNLFEQQKYVESKNIFLTLIDADFELLTCHYYIGLIYLNIKNYSEGLKEFSYCIAVDPTNFNYLYYSGICAEAVNNDQRALDFYSEANRLKPDHLNSKSAIKRINEKLIGINYNQNIKENNAGKVHLSDKTITGEKITNPKENDHNQYTETITPTKNILKKIILSILILVASFCLYAFCWSVFAYYEWTHQSVGQYAIKYSGKNPRDYLIYLITAIILFIIVFISLKNKKNRNIIVSGVDADQEPVIINDLYERLLIATDDDSKRAVQAVYDTHIEKKRPRKRAYLNIVFILFLVFCLVTFILKIASLNVFLLTSIEIPILFSLFIYKLLDGQNTSFTIDRAMIEINNGVFGQNYNPIFIHKGDRYRMHQNFFNLFTNDCSLKFNLDSNETIKLLGLGKPQEVRELAKKLENLRYQLRNTPAIKSGIFN